MSVALAPLTLAALRRQIARDLAATSSTAALDARLLVAHVVGLSPADLILRDDQVVDEDVRTRALAFARRRAAGEPVARIVGTKEFYGLTLALGPATLVPRPDTETIVDAVVEQTPRDAAITILDLGTGSGAILVALLAELQNATGVGVDLSADAIEVARANAIRLGLGARAAFLVGDWAAALSGPFDIVVANPPYIESRAIPGLPVEVRAHDPHLSLDGGDDGLCAYRRIFADLDRMLKKGASAFFEIGAGQEAPVRELAGRGGFDVAFRRDLSGTSRVAVMTRPGLLEAVG